MSDHLFALRAFVRVARKGSFSAAARALVEYLAEELRFIAKTDR
jgi:hypothetical protein